MTTLTKDKLLEYLNHAIELESSILTQKNIISSCSAAYEEKKPKLVLKTPSPSPEYKSTLKYVDQDGRNILKMLGWFLVICGIAALVIALMTMGDAVNKGEGLLIVGTITLILCGLGAILLIVDKKKQQADDKAYQRRMDDYRTHNEQIDKENERITAKYNKDITLWTRANKEARDYLNRPFSETKNTLEELYAADIIYPKYRNLPALTSICEYLITGRCEELTGPHGAYNLYEDEVRKDTVISQLNTVIENLEQIRQNQYMLYEQVKSIQQTTQTIAFELRQIKGYTAVLTELNALNTYYNGITARNSHIIAYWR